MVHLIFDEQGKPIGWEMRPVTEQEHEVAATVRDLQFFGFNEKNIQYDGLELINPKLGKEQGNIKTLTWKQKRYCE